MQLTVPQTVRKYQVFISSTFKDLAEHRRAAIRGIINAGHLPIALENFTPDNKDKITVIRTAIQACQFYVLILGHRYGYRPKQADGSLGPSYVELELNWAKEAKIPIIAFLLDEDIVRKKRDKLAGPKSTGELSSEDVYWNLREQFTGNTETPFYKPFVNAGDIYSELYAFFSRPHDVSGYIPEPEDRYAHNLMQIYAKNEVLRDVVGRFGQFTTVESRLFVATEQKEALAKAFSQIHGDDIEHRYRRLFFESGSTIIYLAKQLALAHRLPQKPRFGTDKASPIVQTNNALAYVYLWLCENVMCHPEPEGPPDEKYGGMYGPLTGRERSPNYDLPGLSTFDPKAQSMIRELCEQVFTKETNGPNTLILAAASGLQLSDGINAVYAENEKAKEGEDIYMKLQECRGFHVGSYCNKLFKRCLYLTESPTVVFIHDSKIDSKIMIGTCHFIFDKEVTWQGFMNEHPLSLWIGCSRNTYSDILVLCRSHFEKGNWNFFVYGDTDQYPIVIGHNDRFREACKAVQVAPFEL
jgi:hypothetical protein